MTFELVLVHEPEGPSVPSGVNNAASHTPLELRNVW